MKFGVFSLLLICEILLSDYGVFGGSSAVSSIKCGKRYYGQDQILSGSQIENGAFPWNAAILRADSKDLICSGTLISANKVVTAAGCVTPKHVNKYLLSNQIRVVLGFHDLENPQKGRQLSATVKNIRIHNEWNPKANSFDADIAILELERDVRFNSYIQPICLIESNSDIASIKNASIVGFEYTANGNLGKIPRILDTPIVSSKKCLQEGYIDLISSRMICGGLANGTGPCNGDGGTGMIVSKNGTYYLRGITSATLYNGYGCNNDAHSIFTDVLKFRDWIEITEEFEEWFETDRYIIPS